MQKRTTASVLTMVFYIAKHVGVTSVGSIVDTITATAVEYGFDWVYVVNAA